MAPATGDDVLEVYLFAQTAVRAARLPIEISAV
jgi:hypothetical protein